MKAKRISAFISAILMCSSMISMSITGTSAEEISSIEIDEDASYESIEDKLDSLSEKCFGYKITSSDYIKFFNSHNDWIPFIEDTFSFFDTFEIDDGYTIEDIMDEAGYLCKSNHFVATGKWGDNIEWVYDHGVLTISGSGEIDPIRDQTGTACIAIPSHEKFPWTKLARSYNEIIIGDGITSIPQSCFILCGCVDSVTLGMDVEYIDSLAFQFYEAGANYETIDIYFPEKAAFYATNGGFYYAFNDGGEGYKKNFVLHGYTNSPIDYYVQYRNNNNSLYASESNLTFESIGTTDTDYSYYYDVLSGKTSKDTIDYTLDLATGTLVATWEDEDQKIDVVNTNKIQDSVVTENGEIDYDEHYYYEYVKKFEIESGIERVVRLKELTNLEVLVVPDSVVKLPSETYLPDDTSKLTIVANTGTYAEEYAKEKGINFVDAKDYSGEITFSKTDLNNQSEETTETDITTDSTTQEIKLGDANLDGEINIADAVFINKYLVDAVQLSDESRTASDCDKDGSVTSADTLVILKYLVGTIDTIE